MIIGRWDELASGPFQGPDLMSTSGNQPTHARATVHSIRRRAIVEISRIYGKIGLNFTPRLGMLSGVCGAESVYDAALWEEPLIFFGRILE